MTPLITDLAIVAVICIAAWGVEKVWKWRQRARVWWAEEYERLYGKLAEGE